MGKTFQNDPFYSGGNFIWMTKHRFKVAELVFVVPVEPG